MFNALGNVVPSHLMDHQLFPFAGLRDGRGRSAGRYRVRRRTVRERTVRHAEHDFNRAVRRPLSALRSKAERGFARIRHDSWHAILAPPETYETDAMNIVHSVAGMGKRMHSALPTCSIRWLASRCCRMSSIPRVRSNRRGSSGSTGHGAEKVQAAVAAPDVQFRCAGKQRGTGHAAGRRCRSSIRPCRRSCSTATCRLRGQHPEESPSMPRRTGRCWRCFTGGGRRSTT